MHSSPLRLAAAIVALIGISLFAYGVIQSWDSLELFHGHVDESQTGEMIRVIRLMSWRIQHIGLMLIGAMLFILAFLIDWRATSKPTAPPPPPAP